MGNAGGAGLLFVILGVILIAVAGNANGVAFFIGVLFFLLGIMIWVCSAVWGMAGFAEETTRRWLND